MFPLQALYTYDKGPANILQSTDYYDAANKEEYLEVPLPSPIGRSAKWGSNRDLSHSSPMQPVQIQNDVTE